MSAASDRPADDRPAAPEVTPASWGMIAALGLTWGATFMVIELALEGITPLWLAAARISLAAVLTTAIWQARGGRLFTGTERAPLRLAGIGVLNSALPFTALSWGQTRVTSGFAGVSMATVPLFVLPLAHLVLRDERMTPTRALGLGLGFLGIVLLIGPEAWTSSGDPLELAGRAACLSAALCYALASITMRGLPEIDPLGLAAVPLVAGAAVVIPAAWLVEGPPPLPDSATLGWLAILGLVPTAGANLLRVLVIRSAGPVFMSLTNYQVPIWSVVLGVVFLGEPAPPSLVAALALVLSGVLLSQWIRLRGLFGR